MNKEQFSKLADAFIQNEHLYSLVSFLVLVTILFFTNTPTFIKAILFTFAVINFLRSSLVMKLLAHTGLYQGEPFVFYFEKDNFSFMNNKSDTDIISTICTEKKQTQKLKLTRLSNIYKLAYKPSYLKDFKDPNIVYFSIFNIGFFYYKNGVKIWHEEPITPKLVPYFERYKTNSWLVTKFMQIMSNTGSDKASLWIDKDLAQLINLAPFDDSKYYVDKNTKKRYVEIYPVKINSIGEGYYNLERETTEEEQEKYKYANKISVGIHKDYVLKVG